MQYRRYRYSTRFVSDGGDEQTHAREVPFGYVLEVTHFSGGMVSEAVRIVALGYTDSTGDDNILSNIEYNHLHSSHVQGHVWIEAGEKPYVKIYRMDATEEGFLSVHGRLWPTEEKVVKDAEVQREPDVPD